MKNTNKKHSLAKEIKVEVIGELFRQFRAVKSECPEGDKKHYDWTSESWTRLYAIIEGSIVSYVLSDDDAFEMYVDDDGDEMYEPTIEYLIVTDIIKLCAYEDMPVEEAQYFLTNWDTQKQVWLDMWEKLEDELIREFKASLEEAVAKAKTLEKLDEAIALMPVIIPKESIND